MSWLCQIGYLTSCAPEHLVAVFATSVAIVGVIGMCVASAYAEKKQS